MYTLSSPDTQQLILNTINWNFKDVVRKLENVDVDGSTPKEDCKIADSGIIHVEEPFNVEKDDAL